MSRMQKTNYVDVQRVRSWAYLDDAVHVGDEAVDADLQ